MKLSIEEQKNNAKEILKKDIPKIHQKKADALAFESAQESMDYFFNLIDVEYNRIFWVAYCNYIVGFREGFKSKM